MRTSKPLLLLASLSLMLSTAYAQTYSTVYTFDGNVGKFPGASLVQGRDGNLYGTTSEGGTFGLGTVFRIGSDGSRFTALHNFAGSDGSYPAGLVLATDGNFYGTASGGTLGNGVIYRINSSGSLTILYNFTGGADGSSPVNSLVQGTDGNFYGANKTGVYRYHPPSTPEIIYPFSYPQPLGTVSQMTQGTDGMLYLVISAGGIYDCGSISKLSLQGAVQWEHDFGTPGTCFQYLKTGWYPSAPVIQASDGNLYGTNLWGGIYGYGTDIRLSPATGAMAVLHSFNLFDQQGDLIYAGLVQGTDGNLYGVAADGGAFPYAGVIYNLTLTGTYTFLVSVGDNQEDWPNWSLLQHTSGKFYSVNLDGGTYKSGTVYSFDNNLGPFVAFVQSQGKIGSTAQILGQGLAGVTGVTFNGLPAASFSVISGTYMTAVVPPGATTGTVVVTTPVRTLKSNKKFSISQ
jgi:uncharacterized repeat protein (TIGR03803 family)